MFRCQTILERRRYRDKDRLFRRARHVYVYGVFDVVLRSGALGDEREIYQVQGMGGFARRQGIRFLGANCLGNRRSLSKTQFHDNHGGGKARFCGLDASKRHPSSVRCSTISIGTEWDFPRHGLSDVKAMSIWSIVWDISVPVHRGK